MSNLLNEKAPDFTLKSTEGEEVTLSDINKSDYIVLLFFPLAFSPGCTNEMCKMRDNMKLYQSLDAKIIGISVDSIFSLKAFKKAENLNFTLLSDFNKEVSKKYDVLYDEFYGMKGVSRRAAFVIDENRTVIYEEVLDDASEMPDFSSINNLLE
jgi:peroxiredoxin